MNFPAIEFKQNGKIFYITCLPAKVVIDLCKIDIWNPEVPEEEIEKQGYQRSPITSHYTKIARYLNDDRSAVLPTAVLISARRNIPFKRHEKSNTGELFLDENSDLYIVDGQHRIYGIMHAIEQFDREDLENFSLPVVIMSGVDKIDEVRQFFIVNSTQKRVRTDLAERLLKMIASRDPKVRERLKLSGRDWKLIAIKIIDELYNDANSVWYQRIKRPNQPPRPEAIASEGSFTTSLKPLLTMFAKSKPDETLIEWVKSFWNALQDLMPEAFEDPREFVIQKTPGIYSLHMVLPDIILYCIEHGGVTKDSIKKLLENDQEHFVDPYFWKSGGEGAAMYNSMGAFKMLAEELREGLKLK